MIAVTPRVGFAMAAVLLCVMLAYVGAPFTVFLASFALVAVSAWFVGPQNAVLFYFATLCLQVPQSRFQFRFAIADCFLLPLIALAALDILRGRKPAWQLLRPLLVIGAALAVASVVAYLRLGYLSSWALLNKDAGFVFLVAGFVALTFQLKSKADVDRAIDVFVGAVSVATLTAIVVGIVGEFLWRDQNIIYPSLIRFYGFLLNPTSQGSLLMIALLLELPRLGMPGIVSRPLRIANYVVLLTALMLTLSRSTWLALAVAAGVLTLALIARRFQPARTIPWRAVAGAVVTAVVPVSALATIAVVNWQSVREVSADQNASQATALKVRLLGSCAVTYDPELCRDFTQVELQAAREQLKSGSVSSVGASGASSAAAPSLPAVPPVPPPPAVPPPLAAPPSPAVPPSAPVSALSSPEGAAMNARGLSDRASIIRLAMKPYSESMRTRILGIGLGTFYATSAADFGVPVIIHSTPAWFLIELGVLGVIGLIWLMAASIVSALRSVLEGDRFWSIAPGVFAALVGWLFLSVLNESFYFRHFWLVLVLSDALIRLRRANA